jgi:hypothetical protein
MQRQAMRELPPEWQQLMNELRELPQLKLRRTRDREVWAWIYHLLVQQKLGAPYDLMKCSLGTNPSKLPLGKLPQPKRSKSRLRLLLDTVTREYPLRPDETEVDRACRLYDGIRKWRDDRRRLTG